MSVVHRQTVWAPVRHSYTCPPRAEEFPSIEKYHWKENHETEKISKFSMFVNQPEKASTDEIRLWTPEYYNFRVKSMHLGHFSSCSLSCVSRNTGSLQLYQRLRTPIDEIEIPLTINNVTVFVIAFSNICSCKTLWPQPLHLKWSQLRALKENWSEMSSSFQIPSLTERKHLFREQLSLSLISALLSNFSPREMTKDFYLKLREGYFRSWAQTYMYR